MMESLNLSVATTYFLKCNFMHGISYKESRVATSQCPNSNKTNLLDTLHYILVQFNFASLDSS